MVENTKRDIEDDTPLTIAVQVVDIRPQPNHDSIHAWLTVRDVEGNDINMTLFEESNCSVDDFQEGEWYELDRAVGNIYQGERQLNPPRYDAMEILSLEGNPTGAEPTGLTNTVQRGPTMLLFRLDDQLSPIDVHEYQLKIPDGFNGDVDELTGKAESVYHHRRSTPVSSFGPMRLVSLERLQTTVTIDDHQVKPIHRRRHTLDPAEPGDRSVLRTFIQQEIKTRLRRTGDYDVRAINEIVETTPELTSDDGRFTASRKYSVGVSVQPDGEVLCRIACSYRFASTFTAAEYMQDHDITGVQVEHDPSVYSRGATATVLGMADIRYTDEVPEVGGISIQRFHLNEERVEAEVAEQVAEMDPKLLRVDYSNSASDPEDGQLQAPQYLHIVPELEELKRLAPEFQRRALNQARMLPNERAQVTMQFASSIGQLPTLDYQLEATPTTASHRQVSADASRNNLRFADGHQNRTGKYGLEQAGVYQAPEGSFDILALYPANHVTEAASFAQNVRSTLTDIGADPTEYDLQRYELSNRFDYTEALAGAAEYDAVLAIVPDEDTAAEANYDDPYPVFKRNLGQNGVPSQMATIDELSGGPYLLNVAAGLVGGAGGIPWRVDEMPGDSEAFLGLDVHRDEETGQHVGASANLVLADGTIFASKSVSFQQGEKFEVEDIADAVQDLVRLYVEDRGELMDGLTLLRDGQVYAPLDQLSEELAQLDAKVNIVEVRKSGAPRVVEGDGDRYTIAPKGTGFVNDSADEGVLVTTGTPELRESDNVGTPQALRVVKRRGPTDIETVLKQVYWLSEAHIGSVSRSIRTPVPVYYADQCAEFAAKGYMVTGDLVRGVPYL